MLLFHSANFFVLFTLVNNSGAQITVLLPDNTAAEAFDYVQRWIFTNFSLNHLRLPEYIRVKDVWRLKFVNWMTSSASWRQSSISWLKDGACAKFTNLSISVGSSWSFENMQRPSAVQHGLFNLTFSGASIKVDPVERFPFVVNGESQSPNRLKHEFRRICSVSFPIDIFNSTPSLPRHVMDDEDDFEMVLINRTKRNLRSVICDHIYNTLSGLLTRTLISHFLLSGLPMAQWNDSALLVDYPLGQSPLLSNQRVSSSHLVSPYSTNYNGSMRSCVAFDQWQAPITPFNFSISPFEGPDEWSLGNFVTYAIHTTTLRTLVKCLWLTDPPEQFLINDGAMPEDERGFMRIHGPNSDRPNVGDMIPNLKRQFGNNETNVAAVIQLATAPNVDLSTDNNYDLNLKFEVSLHLHAVTPNRTIFFASADAETAFDLKLALESENGTVRVERVVPKTPNIKKLTGYRVSITQEELGNVMEVLQMNYGVQLAEQWLPLVRLPLPRMRQWKMGPLASSSLPDWLLITVAILDTPVHPNRSAS